MKDEIDVLSQKYAREYSSTGATYYSSAAQFARYLDKKDIISPVEIWHHYTLPDDMTNVDFFNLLRRLDFLKHYEIFGMQVPQTETLLKAKAEAPKQLNELIKKIQKLNPELQTQKVKTNNQIDFLDGVNFGFPPEDIYYFLNQSGQDIETRNKNLDTLSKQDAALTKMIGKSPDWIISPRRMSKLVKSVRKQSLQKFSTKLHNEKNKKNDYQQSISKLNALENTQEKLTAHIKNKQQNR